ncbi:MAG: hypothetical protein FWB87_03990 [Defluviitaleaceae bacterium]|nr:hypothetical protein [Defluviitaleaceae bacterium]
MNTREKHWQHFLDSGNPISYIAYREQSKKDAVKPFDLDRRVSRVANENI